jgi:DNA-binding PadR family transcriptional regulator
MPERRRPVANLLGLAVLGLLLERPMHPYEMATTLRDRDKDTSFNVKRASLYDVVEALHRAGWIEAQGTERAGRRPERTVYAQTELGHTEFVAWLDELLRVPVKEFPSFLGAVSYLGALGPERAAAALEDRVTRLDEEIDRLRQTQDKVLGEQVPRLFVIEIDYVITMAEAERDWAERMVRDIRSGALGWPTLETRNGTALWVTPDQQDTLRPRL